MCYFQHTFNPLLSELNCNWNLQTPGFKLHTLVFHTNSYTKNSKSKIKKSQQGSTIMAINFCISTEINPTPCNTVHLFQHQRVKNTNCIPTRLPFHSIIKLRHWNFILSRETDIKNYITPTLGFQISWEKFK